LPLGADKVSLLWSKFLPVLLVMWDYHKWWGVGEQGVNHQGAEGPVNKRQPGSHWTAKDLKDKNTWARKLPPIWSKHHVNSLSNRKATWNTSFTWKMLINSYLSQIPKSRIYKGQWVVSTDSGLHFSPTHNKHEKEAEA
jgi:hypothetical protein